MTRYELLYRMAFHPIYLYDIKALNEMLDKLTKDEQTGIYKDMMDLDQFMDNFKGDVNWSAHITDDKSFLWTWLKIDDSFLHVTS